MISLLPITNLGNLEMVDERRVPVEQRRAHLGEAQVQRGRQQRDDGACDGVALAPAPVVRLDLAEVGQQLQQRLLPRKVLCDALLPEHALPPGPPRAPLGALDPPFFRRALFKGFGRAVSGKALASGPLTSSPLPSADQYDQGHRRGRHHPGGGRLHRGGLLLRACPRLPRQQLELPVPL
jgi:hypothetical protein